MYLLRFFESDYEPCIWQRYSKSPPLIPHKNDVVNLDDDNWEPYKVTKVTYHYPEKENDTMTIDVMVKEVWDD